MAKKKPAAPFQSVLAEVQAHYQSWTEDRDTRMDRENGWNDILDAYFGRLPEDWPYLSEVVDPRLRTTILEKKARLTNAKLRGKLVPREGSDIIKARINNALLDFQWDNANEGGTMNYKWGILDQDSRLFGSSFGLVSWRYEENEDGEVIFNGNDFKPLDVRDVGLTHGSNVRNARWIQVSEYKTIDDLENENQVPGEPKYPGLSELKKQLDATSQDRRDSNYTSRLLSLKGLDDKLGQDQSFPVIEIVTEYRPDRWITFSPKHNVILRDIDNPYDHNKIPVVQLKYFPLSDDPWGESEVESVLPLWRAIQATINGFLDTMNIHMKPPLKVVESQVRMETIAWGPEAQWLMDRLDSVQEYSGSGEPLRYFQTTYSSLVSAFNAAMGDLSQNVGAVDPFNSDKTATEIRKIEQQQNVRDQDNQNSLSDSIKDMMSMWLSNNKQFLFANKGMHEYVLKIIGEKDFAFFKKAGLADMELSNESLQQISDVITQQSGDVSDGQLATLVESGETPQFPVITNPEEKDPEKLMIKPKMSIDDTGTEAQISMVPEDFDGTYDYIPDVKSMASGNDQEMRLARQKAEDLLFNNQTVLQLLREEGFKPNAKDILVESFEEAGTKDASRFFSPIKEQEVGGADQGAVPTAGPEQALAQQGLPGVPPTPNPAEQQVA